MTNQISEEEVITKIAEQKGMSIEEITKEIDEIMKKMGTFINRQGAAHLLANNLGVILDSGLKSSSKVLKLNELIPQMGAVTVIGRITRIYSIRHFTTKDNSPGQVRRMEIMDDTGTVTCVLWGKKVFSIEEQELTVGDIVKIKECEPRENSVGGIELHLGSRAFIDKNLIGVDTSNIPSVSTDSIIPIAEVKSEGKGITVAGKIIDKREPREFIRKSDGSQGKVASITIADSSGSIRVSFWNKNVELLLEKKVGDIVKLVDVTSRLNNRGEIELTFQDYSSLLPYDDPVLSSIPVPEVGASLGTFLKINQLTEDQKNVIIVGTVSRIFDVKPFQSGEGKLQSILVLDETGLVTVKFWNEDTEKIKGLKEGDIVRLTSLFPRYNDYSQKIELSFGKYSQIYINDPKDTDVAKFSSLPFIHFSDIEGQVSQIFIKLRIERYGEERTITRADGTSAHVLNHEVIDENGEVGRLTAWDDDIEKISNLVEGNAYEIHLARAKRDQYGVNVTIGRGTNISPTNEFNLEVVISTAADVMQSRTQIPITEIQHLVPGDDLVKIRGFVAKVLRNYVYESCSECSKKVIDDGGTKSCPTHGIVNTRYRMILTVTIDGGNDTGTIITKFFGDKAEKLLGVSADKAFELNERLNEDDSIIRKYEGNVLHKELIITGRVNEDESGQLSFNASWYEEVNISSETDQKLKKFQSL